MKKSSVIILGFVSMLSLMLGGCQTGSNVQPAASTSEVQNIPNTPYTKGPSAPPGSKGPTGAPPQTVAVSSTQQPQAMTEDVNQKFTLN